MTTASEDKAKRPAKEPVADGDKLAYTVPEAAYATGIGKSSIWDMLADGSLKAKKVRGRTVIPREELQRIIDEAPMARAA